MCKKSSTTMLRQIVQIKKREGFFFIVKNEKDKNYTKIREFGIEDVKMITSDNAKSSMNLLCRTEFEYIKRLQIMYYSNDIFESLNVNTFPNFENVTKLKYLEYIEIEYPCKDISNVMKILSKCESLRSIIFYKGIIGEGQISSLPPNLTDLHICNGFENLYPINIDVDIPKNMHSLSFGYYSVYGNLKGLDKCHSLHTLQIHNKNELSLIPQSIKDLNCDIITNNMLPRHINYDNLERLTTNNADDINRFKNLQYLEITSNKPINYKFSSPNLHSITLCQSFDQPPDFMIDLKSLESLTMYNMNYDLDRLPPNRNRNEMWCQP
jgi:hypothetical protein